jgi:hypothetical protein
MTDELTGFASQGVTDTIRRITRTDPDSRGGGSESFDQPTDKDEGGEKKAPPDVGGAVRSAGPGFNPGEPVVVSDALRLSSSARAILDQADGTPDGAPDGTEEAPSPEARIPVDFMA